MSPVAVKVDFLFRPHFCTVFDIAKLVLILNKHVKYM